MVVTSRDLFSVGKQTFAATSILTFDIELLVIIFVALLSIKKNLPTLLNIAIK